MSAILIPKIFIISIITLISSIHNSKKNNFNFANFKNSIYFSDIDPLSNLEFTSEIQRPHKIDQVIFKLEHKSSSENFIKKLKNAKKNFSEKSKKSRTFLNMKISKKFYEINFCIDEMDALNKNQLLKYFPNTNNKSGNSKRTNDYFHQELVNILRKNDFTEIDPKNYNDEKIEKRYNNKNDFLNKKKNDKSKNEEFDNLDSEGEDEENNDFYSDFDIEFEKCFRKFEFLNEDNPRFNMKKSEEFNLMKIINATEIKQNSGNSGEEYEHIFDEFLNIKIGDTILKLKKFVNDYIKWEDDNITIEFNFAFNNVNLLNLNFKDNENENSNNNTEENENSNKFILTKVFIYFLQSPKLELEADYINKININFANFKSFKTKKAENAINKEINKHNKDNYISLIQTSENFENIYIDYKILNKQIKYTKDLFGEKNPKISIKQISQKNETSSLIKKFYTLQRESIFHNKLTTFINLNFHKKEISSTNINNKICLLIYFHLTEDTYIEKNELKLFLDKSHPNFEKDFFFSEEIDQEIPADVSKQYFISISFCGNKELFSKEIFNEENLDFFKLEIPVHFRYQPPLYHLSHQEVFLNLPLVDILIQENQIFSLEKTLVNKSFFKFENFSTKKFEEKNKIRNKEIVRFFFDKEIKERLKWINEMNLMFENLDEIRHFIPVAQMQHFYLVMFGTFISAFIGFFIILFGVLNNKIKEKLS